MRKLLLGVSLIVLSHAAAAAQTMTMPMNANDLKWGPAPPSLPRGAEIAVLAGDPTSDGPYVLRAKVPANYKIPAHNHPTAENVTVLSGTFHIGMGDKLDETTGVTLHSGGFASAPAGMNHFAWSDDDVVLQIHGQGPFAITYVNPADDPSRVSDAK